MAAILLICFIVFLFMGVPVAFALGLSSFVFFILNNIPMVAFAQKMYSGLDVFTLLCIPGFILAGNLMNGGGLTNRIIEFSKTLVGHIRGGVGISNVLASMVFAGISGTALADVASIGSIMIPSMKKEGYAPRVAVAISASSSLVGPIIPPSLPMIVVGTLMSVSVGKLFVAGIIPGMLLGGGIMGIVYFIARKNNYPVQPRATIKQTAKAFYNGIWALIMVALILFGILGGLFTPTEASIIAVIYALFVGMFIYKELNTAKIFTIVSDSIRTTAGLMLMVGFANIFAWILATEQVPQMVASALLGVTSNKFILLLLINLIFMFAGMFLETISALLILVPVLLKVALEIDMDPIQFGIMAILNLVIGLTTPPVGVCLFVASSIGRISIADAVKGLMPFFVWMIAVLLAITYIPALTLYLPSFL